MIMSKVPPIPVFTPEQHQRILYGLFYDGVDQPLKPISYVRDQICTARSYRRIKSGSDDGR